MANRCFANNPLLVETTYTGIEKNKRRAPEIATPLLRIYSQCIKVRLKTCNKFRMDPMRNRDARIEHLQSSRLDEGFMMDVQSLQRLMEALLDLVLSNEITDNDLAIQSFQLSIRDISPLFEIINAAIHLILRNFNKMTIPVAESSLQIYNTFVSQTERYNELRISCEGNTMINLVGNVIFPEVRIAPLDKGDELSNKIAGMRRAVSSLGFAPGPGVGDARFQQQQQQQQQAPSSRRRQPLEMEPLSQKQSRRLSAPPLSIVGDQYNFANVGLGASNSGLNAVGAGPPQGSLTPGYIGGYNPPAVGVGVDWMHSNQNQIPPPAPASPPQRPDGYMGQYANQRPHYELRHAQTEGNVFAFNSVGAGGSSDHAGGVAEPMIGAGSHSFRPSTARQIQGARLASEEGKMQGSGTDNSSRRVSLGSVGSEPLCTVSSQGGFGESQQHMMQPAYQHPQHPHEFYQ
ncbi:hypothetical protein HDU76_006443, partial [Blyttiomyces sp. JEL0837]